VKNRPETADIGFLKTELRKPSFRFLNFEVGSVRFLENRYPKFSSDSAHPYNTLESRREQLTKRFFRRSVIPEESCLHYLLPDKCDSSTVDKLHYSKTFHLLTAKTKRLKNSFIPYCLIHYLLCCIMLVLWLLLLPPLFSHRHLDI